MNLNYGENPCNSKAFSLNPGDECTIGVLYEPEKTTDVESAIYIESNDPVFPLSEIKIYSDPDKRLFVDLPDRGCSYGSTSLPIWLILPALLFIFIRLKQL